MAGIFMVGMSSAVELADVLIVGGGISGTLTAIILARAGYQVCLIDRHEFYPPDFRAEHLDGPMVDQLRRLELLDHLTVGLSCGETVAVARLGRILRCTGTINYGLRYEKLVNRARTSLPPNARMVIGRVAGIKASNTFQQVHMADGRTITGRLLVIATGQGFALCKQLGITRTIIRESHSLTFGFNIEPAGPVPFEHSFLVYQSEKIQDRVDYLAAFTMNRTTRVNLFTYRSYHDPWTRAFINDPGPGLAQLLPGFGRVMGPYRAVGPAVARPIDLYTSHGHQQDGVVLIGDAFQMSCPATGMGMVRLLTDVEQLCKVYIPAWLACPGMSAAKITAYYRDPVKRACDAKALHDSEYRRSVSTETGLGWRVHRTRVRAVAGLLDSFKRHRPFIRPAHGRKQRAAFVGDGTTLPFDNPNDKEYGDSEGTNAAIQH
jgi:2-polyprenyl-6-methoxyphenol hydroxylase-like FAD-dependent oxidoreductase